MSLTSIRRQCHISLINQLSLSANVQASTNCNKERSAPITQCLPIAKSSTRIVMQSLQSDGKGHQQEQGKVSFCSMQYNTRRRVKTEGNAMLTANLQCCTCRWVDATHGRRVHRMAASSFGLRLFHPTPSPPACYTAPQCIIYMYV